MRKIQTFILYSFILFTFLLHPFSIMAALPGARSATDGVQQDVFLGGNYIEVGINRSGSFGSLSNKPGGFYGTTVRNTVGMSVDFDGFGTATDYRMDYFMPGSPFEAWAAGYKISGAATQGYNALQSSAEQITGTTVTNTSSGDTLSARVVGTLNSNLKITQNISFGVNDKFFKNVVTLENVGASTLDNVRYMRVFDPDNTRDQGGNFATFNKILYTYGTDGKTAVMSDTSNNASDPIYLALGTRSPILYYSSDSHARVNNSAPVDVYASSNYDSAPAKNNSNSGDTLISITFDVGTLAPAASQSVTFYTSLDDRDFSEVLADIQQDEAPSPTPTPTQVLTNSSYMPSAQWTDTKGDTFNFQGVLLENMYTEDTLPTFVFTEAKDSNVGLAKYQLILSGPNYPSKVYFDEIAPSYYGINKETADRFTEYNKDLHRISVRSKRDLDKLPNGEYKWKVRAFNTQGHTIDSAEKVIRIGTYKAVFSNTVFPISLLQAGNLTNLDISSIHPDKSLAPLKISTHTPTFYGIANVNAHMKLIIRYPTKEVFGEFKTNANTESRFGINVDKPLSSGVYTVELSATNDAGDFVELPSFNIIIN